MLKVSRAATQRKSIITLLNNKAVPVAKKRGGGEITFLVIILDITIVILIMSVEKTCNVCINAHLIGGVSQQMISQLSKISFYNLA